ncbi:methionine biosynthesis protein MetW [Actinomycetospora straminea]|uniref:Methyltransferase family protein n=1 Tax=Actinomycetospora straminea TaxID=663607 RepID=A0ABP9FJG7_9PSEU
MRADLELIYDWVPQGAHILDLACGGGALLERLAQEKNVSGYGLEIDPEGITQCVARGVNVIEHNLDDGLIVLFRLRVRCRHHPISIKNRAARASIRITIKIDCTTLEVV